MKNGTAENPRETMHIIDKTLHMIMVEGEKKLPTTPTYWWSGPLHKAYLVYQYWSQARLFWRTNIDGTR
eukprot:1865278-Ditylum_brightwellii.AAC.1